MRRVMMIQRIAGNAVYYTSSLFDDIRSYPQPVDNSVDKDAKPCGKPMQNLRIVHGFSTKHGGVSTKPYISDLNFGFSVGEERAVTVENYRRFAAAIGVDFSGMLCANQTHTSRVLRVDARYRGMGLEVPLPALPAGNPLEPEIAEAGFDGFVTAEPGVALVVRAADCVPILFCDPVAGVIGACHAGWRGTVAGIAAETVRQMEALGAVPESIRAAIGFSIGLCCYEVDDAFYETFRSAVGADICRAVFAKNPGYENPEKWHCDLRACNRLLLEAAGVPAANIDVSEMCTYCHSALFHSHRYAQRNTGGVRGLMAACISMESNETR